MRKASAPAALRLPLRRKNAARTQLNLHYELAPPDLRG